MHYPDQIERWRDQTTSPYDRLRTELDCTPKWRVIKRKHLSRDITDIENTVRELDLYSCE